MTGEWLTQTAAVLGRGIAAQDIDPRDLTEVYLDAIASHEMTDRIYARTTADRARAEAAAAAERAAIGMRRGPLDGVPISWKDLFDTAGTATEAGSALLAGRVPDQDADVLRAATAKGLVCLGKTHMSELAFSGLGLNPVTATSPSVNDTDAVSGGSSSGAAASVAFGLAAAGIGSDTGGSVRIPSAWNDLVGLKTTSGLLSLGGVVPLCAAFDTVGPLAQSVEDASLLMSAMLGVENTVDLAGASLAGRKLAVCRTIALDDLEDAPARAFERAVSALSAAGAQITEIDLPSVADALALSGCLFAAEAYGTWATEIEARGEVMFDEIRARFEGGLAYSAVDYVRAQQQMMQARQGYARLTAGFDAVILPTSPLLPPNQHLLETDSETYTRANLLALRNTRIGNLMGLCGLTLPTTEPSCGLMLLGAPFTEAALLRLGAAAEPIVR